MRKKNLYSACLFLAAVALFQGGVVLAVEPAAPRASGIDNLLRGTQYEQLLTEYRDQPPRMPDKGFLPNLGNWFNSDTPGWGLDIQALGNVLFAVWFTYNLDGTPTWYIIVGVPVATDKGMAVSGNIESFKWDPQGAPGSQATATVAGTMTIEFADESNATASWTLDGEQGGAPISFIRFAPPPTPANMTGHYFDAVRPGWGFTLLTQGSTTVMTMYWYKNGQPVWAQGVVSSSVGFNLSIVLQYFLGPGLCPSCLDDKDRIKGGPQTEPIGTMIIQWGLDDPPVVAVTPPFVGNKGGPLGADAFSDIFLPVTTEAITSALVFDPEYTWFIDTINSIGKGGPDCLKFDYSTSLFTGSQPGTTESAWFKLTPVDDAFPVFTDADCTQPFNFTLDGIDFVQSGFMLGWTGEDGNVFRWSALFEVPPGAKGDDDDDDGDSEREGVSGGASIKRPLDDKGISFDIGWYGGTRFVLAESGLEKFYLPLFVIQPPSLPQMQATPENNRFLHFTYPEKAGD